MKTISSRAVKMGLTIGLMTVVLFGAACWTGVFLFHSPGAQSWLQREASRLIPGKIAWEALDLSVLNREIRLEGLRLTDPQDQELAEVKTVTLSFDFSGLPDRRLIISRILIESPRVFLSVDPDGKLNLVSALVFPEEPENTGKYRSDSRLPVDLMIRSALLNNGCLKLAVPHQQFDTRLDSLVFQLSDLTVAGAQVQIPRISIHAGESGLQASGQIDDIFDAPDIRMDIRSSISLDQVSGILKTALPATGQVFFAAAGEIETGTGVFGGRFSLNVQEMAGLSGTAGIPDLSGRLSARGTFHGTKGRGAADIEFQGGQMCLPDARIDRLSGTAGLLISPEAMSGSIRVSMTDAAVKEILLDAIEADLALSPEGRLTVDRLAVRKNRSSAGLSGWISLREEPGGRFVKSPRMDITLFSDALFPEEFIPGVTGRVTVSGRMSGPVDDPEGEIRVKANNLMTGEVSVDRLEADIRMVDHRIMLDRLSAAAFPGATVSGSGWYELTAGAFGLDLTAGVTELSVIRQLEQRGLETGALNMTVTGSGTIEQPVFESRVRLTGLAAAQIPLPDMDMDVVFRDGRVTASGEAGGTVNAVYQLDSGLFNGSVDMGIQDLAPYFRMAGIPDLSGRVGGRVSVTGNAADLKTLSAQADLSDFQLKFRQAEVARAQSVRLSLNRGILKFHDSRFTLPEDGWMDVTGQGGSADDMSVKITAQIPAAALESVYERAAGMTGSLSLSAAVSGKITAPDISAVIGLSDIDVPLAVIDQKLDGRNLADISGEVRLTDGRIVIPMIQGAVGRGQFSVTGRADLSEWHLEKAELILSLSQIPVEVEDTMELILGGRLAVAGNLQGAEVKGDISLLSGRYYKDVSLDVVRMGSEAARKKRVPQPRAAEPVPALLDAVRLDINVTAKEPFMIENNLADLSLTPILTIRGTAGHPLLNGRTAVDSGVVRFRKKEFDITKGSIDFINPYRIEPVIDLEGALEVRNWTIFLTAAGTPENLDIHFRSDPGESHADILSLVAFGKTTRELRNPQDGTDFNAARILAGFVAETMQKDLKSVSGLDHLEIDVGSDADSGRYGGRVTMGKDLSQQMTVKYGVDVRANETVQQITTDYKIMESLIITGFRDTNGNFGGGVKYRLEFR